MKKIGILLLVLLCGTIGSMAQKVQLSDIVSGVYNAKTVSGVRPMLDGAYYTRISADNKQIVQYSFKTGELVKVIFDVAKARNVTLKSFTNYQFSPNEQLILIETDVKPIYRRSYTAVYYLYNVRNNTLEPLSENGPQQVPVFSPDGNQVAFVRNNNIYLVKLLFGKAESQVTTDGSPNQILNGIPDWVYEEEFGFNRAFDFSADSKMIAYVRFDESKVHRFSFPLYKGMAPEHGEFADYPGQYSYKYPKAGYDNAKVSVHTFDIKSRVTRTVRIPIDSTSYIPRIRFTSDPEKLAIATLNRHQNRFDLYMANPRSCESKLILRDESDQYVKEETYDALTFYPGHFVMMSEKDGYNHLYLYNLQGTLVRRLTQGKFVVTDFYGWDARTNKVYYGSTQQSPLERQVYTADAKGRITALTTRKGTHNAVFSSDFSAFVDYFSDVDVPTRVSLNDARGKELAALETNDTLQKRLAGLQLPQKEFFTFRTSEGVELNGWMCKPADFDPQRKYPVILFQYSGPGSQQVLRSWRMGGFGNGAIFETYLCQEGYIAVCVDGRGTGGRGAAFEKNTYLHLGVNEAKDQVETALYLGKLPYVDAARIGIWGWSFGGYNTLMSLSEGRPVFKAGIAIAAPTDWRFYDSVYTERFMRTPQENADGYRAGSAFERIPQLHGELLLVHGTADDNVHFQNMIEYSEALVQAGKQFEMQVYTNRNHSIYGGKTRLHLLNRMVRFFNTHLKND